MPRDDEPNTGPGQSAGDTPDGRARYYPPAEQKWHPPEIVGEAHAESAARGGDAVSVRARLLEPHQLADLPTPTLLAEDWIYTGTLAQLAGPSGSYKSFIALRAAIEAARAGNPVAYLAGEGAAGQWLRVAGYCQHHGIDYHAEVKGRLWIMSGTVQLGHPGSMDQLAYAVEDVKAALIVVDTKARATVGTEENSAREQGMIIAACDGIIATTGATMLMVHHTGRNGGHGRGSSAWDGAVWSDLEITADPDERTAVVRCAKHKDALDQCRHGYRLVSVQVDPAAVPKIDDPARRWTLVAEPMEIAPTTTERGTTRVGTPDLVQVLDRLQVPVRAGRPTCQRALDLMPNDQRPEYSTDALTAAVKIRKGRL